MTIQKRDKRRRGRPSKVSLPPPDMEEKAYFKPPVDTMVKNDNICKWCGRRMLSVRCQCGYVKPINK